MIFVSLTYRFSLFFGNCRHLQFHHLAAKLCYKHIVDLCWYGLTNTSSCLLPSEIMVYVLLLSHVGVGDLFSCYGSLPLGLNECLIFTIVGWWTPLSVLISTWDLVITLLINAYYCLACLCFCSNWNVVKTYIEWNIWCFWLVNK